MKRHTWSAPLLFAVALAACTDEDNNSGSDQNGSSSSSSGSSGGSSSSSTGGTSSGESSSGADAATIQLSLSSATLALAPGSTLSVDVTTSANEPLELSVSNLPLGVAGTFSPVLSSTTSVLTLSAALDAPPASVSLLVRAQSPSGAATAQASLSVTAPSSDISVFAVPSAIVLSQGRSTPLQLNVARRGAFTGDVELSFGPLPVGVSIEPSTLRIPSGASTGAVTLTVSAMALPGASNTIAVLGQGGSGAEGSFSLQVPIRSGSLDTTFGQQGSLVTDAAFTSFFGSFDLQHARTPDDKLLVCGNSGLQNIGVARLLLDGSLDPTFNGGNGTKTLPIGGGTSDRVIGCAAQADGKIVVLMQGTGTVLARLLPTGEPDESYGVGGYVALSHMFWANAMDLAADGKLLIAGQDGQSGTYLRGVGRLDADGNFDPTFGVAGFAALPQNVNRELLGVTVQGTSIVGFGSFYDTRSYGTIVRWTDTGALDDSFDGDGILDLQPTALERVTAAAVQADGKLVFSGTPDSLRAASVARVLPSGETDVTFGDAGIRKLGFSAAWINSVLPLSDGIIVVAGKGVSAPSQSQFYVARLTGDGAFDPSFNDTGWLMATPSPALSSTASAVHRLDDGKLLLAGSVGTPPRAAVMRVWP